MYKAQYKLHREIDFGKFLKRIRDTQNLIMSYSTSKVFDPETLVDDYQTAYSNVIQVSLATDESLEEEYALPLPVNYLEP